MLTATRDSSSDGVNDSSLVLELMLVFELVLPMLDIIPLLKNLEFDIFVFDVFRLFCSFCFVVVLMFVVVVVFALRLQHECHESDEICHDKEGE